MTLICWSLSSPINSHDDERYHIGSIWCAEGYDDDCKFLGKTNDLVEVASLNLGLCTPAGIEETYKRALVEQNQVECRYKTRANELLSNFKNSPNSIIESNGFVATDFNTTNYPTTYQKFMSSFISKNTLLSLLIMRNINSILMCLLFIVLLIIAKFEMRNSFILAITLTVIPQGLFIASSINPSSWTFIGSTFSWAFLWIIVNSERKISLSNFIAFLGWGLASILAISSRYESPLWLILTNLIVLYLHFFTKKNWFRATSAFFGVLVVGVFVYQQLGSSTLRSIFPSRTSRFFEPSALAMAIGGGLKTALAAPMRLLGLEDFGWSGNYPPKVVFFGGTALVILVISALTSFKEFRMRMFFLVFALFFLIICVIQVALNPTWMYPFYLIRTGWSYDLFRSRYFLPILPFFVGVTALISPEREKLIQNAYFKNALVVILTFTHAISLQSVGQIFRLNPSWYWPNFPLNIDFVLILGAVSFFIFVITITKILGIENLTQQSQQI